MRRLPLAMMLTVMLSSAALAQAGGGSAAGAGGAAGAAGAANAAAASQSVGGGSVPTIGGTAPGTTNPGGINGINPQPAPGPTAAVPRTGTNSAGTANSAGRNTVGSSAGNVATTGTSSQGRGIRKDTDDVIAKEDRALDRKIRSICRGC